MKTYNVMHDTWIKGTPYSRGAVVMLEDDEAKGPVSAGLIKLPKKDDDDAREGDNEGSVNISTGPPGQFEPPARSASAVIAEIEEDDAEKAGSRRTKK